MQGKDDGSDDKLIVRLNEVHGTNNNNKVLPSSYSKASFAKEKNPYPPPHQKNTKHNKQALEKHNKM